jgi:hypothetical protein
MKKIYLILLLIVLTVSVWGQADQPIGTPRANEIGDDTSQMKLVDITLNQFEDPGYWYGAIAADMGVISLRRRPGFPSGREDLDAERLESEASIGAPIGQNVLGVKVKYYRRAIMSFSIYPLRPIPIPGKCKTISVWTIGRNFNHRLKIILEDYFGDRHELTMEKLNFLGWKKLTVAVPPTIRQSDYHFTNVMGVKVVGFKVYCDLEETIGSFYIYFDDLSAVTDLFESDYRDSDDIPDDW